MSSEAKNNILYIVSFVFIMCLLTSEKSCICTSNRSKKHNIFVDFHTHNKALEKDSIVVLAGTIDEMQDSTYNMKFKAVRGGASYFLGIKFNEVNWETDKKRVTIKCHRGNYNFSVQDVLSFPLKEKENLKVYIAPKICPD